MSILDDINKYARPEDKPVLLWLLNRYHTRSSWYFVADCEHVKTGKLSYEYAIVWKPTNEGTILYNYYTQQ